HSTARRRPLLVEKRCHRVILEVGRESSVSACSERGWAVELRASLSGAGAQLPRCAKGACCGACKLQTCCASEESSFGRNTRMAGARRAGASRRFTIAWRLRGLKPAAPGRASTGRPHRGPKVYPSLDNLP